MVHSAQYGGADAYRGKSVLVAGYSISALEIASDLAMSGAAKVTVAFTMLIAIAAGQAITPLSLFSSLLWTVAGGVFT